LNYTRLTRLSIIRKADMRVKFSPHRPPLLHF